MLHMSMDSVSFRIFEYRGEELCNLAGCVDMCSCQNGKATVFMIV